MSLSALLTLISLTRAAFFARFNLVFNCISHRLRVVDGKICVNYLHRRLQDQAQRQLKKGGKFEDLSAGECRPSALIERYDNLFSQTRLDAMDKLDEVESLNQMDDSGDIKNKILFSVLVVSTKLRIDKGASYFIQLPPNFQRSFRCQIFLYFSFALFHR